MKKRRVWLRLLVILMIVVGLVIGLVYYIAPSKELTMDYRPVNLEEKLLHMARHLNTELILTESDINAIIKPHLPLQPQKQLTIKGAHFTVEHDKLYADLHVLVANYINAEVSVQYAISWEDPILKLTPTELSIKDMKLPVTWLEDFQLQLYDKEETFIGIDRLYTDGNELVIKLVLHLF